MADSLKNLRRLETVASTYSIFEADQVLTFDQLNSLTDYLSDQERLTRVALLGVGIVGGLRVARSGATVTVTRGVGITTDGDLLALPVDTVFSRFKIYDKSAPVYGPLYDANGVMRSVFQLIPDGASDDVAKPLTAFPGNLAQMVVMLLMESSELDQNLCAGGKCDNLGKTAVDAQRLLLVSRSDASSLISAPASVSDAARALDELTAARPAVGKGLSTPASLAAVYRSACQSIHTALVAALPSLSAQLPRLTGGLFGGDPAPAWIARLVDHQIKFSDDLSVQYYYDFLKDLVETWNALREALLADDSVLFPDPNSLPKHLMLGDLTDPTQIRTGLLRSPLTSDGCLQHAHAECLARKLHVQINAFSVPTTDNLPIVVTPSRGEAATLEDRAIPFYYAVEADFAIQQFWNFRLSHLGRGARNLGYRAREYGGTKETQNPLAAQLGRYDFFRIEGHFRQNVNTAKGAIEKLISNFNLPFIVRAVLIDSDRQGVVVKPPVRYGDLHRIHSLLRAEVTNRLSDSGSFNDRFKARIDSALGSRQIPDDKISDIANTRSTEVKTAIAAVQPSLAATNYADYRRDQTWKKAFPGVVNAATNFKSALGDIVRTDVATPFDEIAISNHAAWIDWLDMLIQSKENTEDDKLLFSNFLAAHPEFEHFGGVGRGGTFILVYDAGGQVVADGTLPYYWPETAENQPQEPVLQPPVFRPPLLIDNSFQLKPPLDFQFNTRLTDFQAKIEPLWNAKLDVQKDYFNFFKDSIGVFSKVVTPQAPGKLGLANLYTDGVLGVSMEDLTNKADQINTLRDLLSRSDITDAQRKAATTQLQSLQADLSKSIVAATTYISTVGIDVATAADGGKALSTIAGISSTVSDSAARDQLQKGLSTVLGQSKGAQQVAVGNLIQAVGLKQG
jgi:hypothetical protein